MTPNKLLQAKEKLISSASSVSGLTGIFSSYNVCHNICTAAIALLSVVGITIAGMPLLFLQKVALPIWVLAVALFFATLLLYLKNRHCMSKNMLVANFGLLTIGTPFVQETAYKPYFWAAGGIIVAYSAIMVIKGKISSKKKAK